MIGKVVVSESYKQWLSFAGSVPQGVSVRKAAGSIFSVVAHHASFDESLCITPNNGYADAIAQLVADHLDIPCRRYDDTLGS